MDEQHAYSEEELRVLKGLMGGEFTEEFPVDDHHLSNINKDTNMSEQAPFESFDPENATREEMIHYCTSVFGTCPTYHAVLTLRMISMISDILLRHMCCLLQELTDIDVATRRWNENDEFNKKLNDQEFQLTTAEEDDDPTNVEIEETDLVLAEDDDVEALLQKVIDNTGSSETPDPLFVRDEEGKWLVDGAT